MEELDFRKIKVDSTTYDLRERRLARDCMKKIKRVVPENWYLGKESNKGFSKYTEDTTIEDSHIESENFRNSLNFDDDNQPEPSLEDLYNKTKNIDVSSYEGDDNSNELIEDNYEEDIDREVCKKFSLFLRDNREDILSLLEDPNGLEKEDLSDVASIVTKDVLDDEDPEALIEDDEALSEKFTFYINNLYEARKRRSDYISEEALKDAFKENRLLEGFIIKNSDGDWLSLDDRGNYSFEDSINLAELFESEEVAEDVLRECIGRRESRNCTIEPFYRSKKNTIKNIKESGTSEANLVCEEFDRLFPEGNPHRTEYDLIKRLMTFANVDEDAAKKIAKRFFN